MEEKNEIDELMFGGGSLLGIQNQVDDLVTAEEVSERRFDDRSIQATTLMDANDAVEAEDNVDADLKWIEQSIYDDDDNGDSLISTREIDFSAKIERDIRKEQKEENQYGSCYNFLYQIDKLFEYAGEKPKEEDEDMDEDFNEDQFETIFMQWSFEEIRFYFELMWKQSIDYVAQAMKGIVDSLQ